MDTTRRRLLAATATVGATALAGCAGIGGSRAAGKGSLDIQIRNRSGEAQTVTVRVTDGDGGLYEEFVDETVPADVSRAYGVSAPADGRYGITVQGADWATGGTWDPAVCPEYRFVTTLDRDGERPSVTAESDCRSD